MTSKKGFYKQGHSLIHIINAHSGSFSAHDWSNDRYYLWTSIPKDCEFLGERYDCKEVQMFLKSNPQG